MAAMRMGILREELQDGCDSPAYNTFGNGGEAIAQRGAESRAGNYAIRRDVPRVCICRSRLNVCPFSLGVWISPTLGDANRPLHQTAHRIQMHPRRRAIDAVRNEVVRNVEEHSIQTIPPPSTSTSLAIRNWIMAASTEVAPDAASIVAMQ